MKINLKAFVPALLLAGVATTASAETAMERAVHHFNENVHRDSDKRVAPVLPSRLVTVSERGRSPLDTAVRIFNQSAESQSDLIGVTEMTRVDGRPAYGAEIVQRLSEE